MSATHRIGLALIALIALAAPAAAEWTRVAAVPTSDVFAVTAVGDTLVAGLQSSVIVSTDAGATWHPSATIAPGLNAVSTVLVHNGRLYAGTDRQGVFVSDDLGATWANYSQGIVGLGSLDIAELIVSGQNLYAATVGGGAWVRNLNLGPWIDFSNEIEAAQGANMTTIAAGGTRLFAAGGFNGSVFHRDPGETDWTESLLFNDHLAPGLAGLSAIFTGNRWVVGSNIGIFHSAAGQAPWTFVDFGLRPILFVGFALNGNDLYASLGTGGGSLVTLSHDGGATWQNLDTLAAVFIYRLARHGTTLYAGRVDGLWRRSIDSVTDAPDGVPPRRLAFAITGPLPVRDRVHFTFELPEPGPIAIEVFDVEGRRVGEALHDTRPAGHGELDWNSGPLAAGIYHARLSAARASATVRIVRTAAGRR